MGIRADQVATVNNEQMGDHAEWDAHGYFVYDVALKADERIAELEALLSVSRDLNRKYVDALRKVADHKATVGPLDSSEEAMASYGIALSEVKLIAQQALPITETR